MAYPDFTVADLQQSQDRLDQLQDACSQQGAADGLTQAIASAVGKVNAYTAAYTLDVDRWKGFVRKLAMYELLTLARSAGTEDGKDYDRVMQELRDIRDGKERTLPAAADNVAPTPVATMSSGYQTAPLATW